MRKAGILLCMVMVNLLYGQEPTAWIRINQLGYLPVGSKTAVWCSKGVKAPQRFELVDAASGKTVFKATAGKDFGAYGPFSATCRLDFSAFSGSGNFRLRAGGVVSPVFRIDRTVYSGSADFCLRYMRQQRSGFNPFLKDSCHTADGYTLYGPMPDSSFVSVSGGWHDASDYLQYATTSANATYHLLMAWRDFPAVFKDKFETSGLAGGNGHADVLDEAKWGLDWLLKMHPAPDLMFNQIADDRDHAGMRLPAQDSFYGRGIQRPVYFLSGEPQQRGKFLNSTTGTSSTAAKFASAFALAANLQQGYSILYRQQLAAKAVSALAFADRKPGVSQTASVRAPYIYAEDNWVDDMELALAAMAGLSAGQPSLAPALAASDTATLRARAFAFAQREPLTPWLGKDTASHYQWYPFINLGHFELAKQTQGPARDTLVAYYRRGIEAVWQKAQQNAFYRGIPFIWCSNNLTVSFAIQCGWYQRLTGDKRYNALAQANIDWLFGCNPWGTSMVYGLPAGGDTPVDPHSAFTHLGRFPIDGGLVDGPVYTAIFKSLIGLTLYEPDEYAAFQSDLAVYHDDYGDYSTNEPTMDGTASLVYLLASQEAQGLLFTAITRGDSNTRQINLVFTGHDYANSGAQIRQALSEAGVKASFFFTGDFYRNPTNRKLIRQLEKDGHYLGPHGDKHLLYADWKKRDSLLVSRAVFDTDFQNNLRAMAALGIDTGGSRYFLPAYEWYNDSIVSWTAQQGWQLINYTPGTLSHADYTEDSERNYRDNATILASIKTKEESSGLNGFILLMHIGAGPGRRKPFAAELPGLLRYLKEKGYRMERLY